jgi:hypothetical protein
MPLVETDPPEEAPAREPSVLEDGVYLDLPEDVYHNATALGSGDMRRLAVSPPDFWFNSKMNPLWHPDDSLTPAKIVGTAAHVMVLYGREEFDRRYGATDYPGNIKAGQTERRRLREAGRIPIHREEWERIYQIGGIIRANPTLAQAFSGGAASEVSVFWTSPDGIKKKCRIDYLKTRASVDLKTVTNRHEGMSFVQACRQSIATYNYPLQAEHYREGRDMMAGLVRDGRLWDGVDGSRLGVGDCDKRLTECIESKTHAFVIVFVQKTGAPLTWACSLSRGNGILDIARRMIERAEDNWRMYMEKFGRETPWLLEEPLDEISVEELPTWWAR